VARVVYEPLRAKMSHLILEGISTLIEFLGYADLMDFGEISPEHSRDNGKRKCDGKC